MITDGIYFDNSTTACDWYGDWDQQTDSTSALSYKSYGKSYGNNFIKQLGTGDSLWETYGKVGTTSNSKEWLVDYADCTTLGSPYKVYCPSSGNIKVKVWYENRHFIPVPQTPANRLKELLTHRQAPMAVINRNRSSLQIAADIREERARETLRRVLGESRFRSYVSNGFVSVAAKSGLVYQIFPGHGISKVYDRGKMVERLCVVLRGNFPPTDSLIMRYLMIINNEQQFREFAISHRVNQNVDRNPLKIDQRPLTEIFREFKGVA